MESIDSGSVMTPQHFWFVTNIRPGRQTSY